MVEADEVRVMLRAHKAAAWQRAKAELATMLEYDGHRRLLPSERLTDKGHSEGWQELEGAVAAFIAQIESEGLHE